MTPESEATLDTRDIIVIGGSAGSVEAARDLVSALPADLPAALFLTVHISPTATSHLPEILSRAGPIPALHPRDGEEIRPGRLYVAPPDNHLLVREGHVHLSRGPRENGTRPSINPLFRTAALSYGPRVVGVVLTGTLDDGTAGMIAVEDQGGVTVVQDPEDALFPGMPRSVLEFVDADHVMPLAGIARLLPRLAREPAPPHPVPHGERRRIAETMEALMKHGGPPPDAPASGYTCPECQGAMWEVRAGDLLQYRCRIGHVYSEQTFLSAQMADAEEWLVTSLTALEEAASLARKMAERARERGRDRWRADRMVRQAEAMVRRAHAVQTALAEEIPTVDERE